MKITNKVILITSSNAWGKMHISKHHYATELSKKNNTVYFLNPPQHDFKKRIKTEKISDNLFVISYKPIFPFKIRFHIRFIYDLLIKLQIKLILKQISKSVDVLLCFETNLFSNLNDFKAKIKIYFPVDMVYGLYQKKIIKSADLILSVSSEIIKKIETQANNKNIYYLNHGLSSNFVQVEKSISKNDKTEINVCFVGNLYIYSLDRKIFKTIIEQNPEIVFNIYSPYNVADANIGGSFDFEATEFLSFLKSCKNVILKGVVETKVLSEELHNYDAFILLINPEKDINKGANSHKIMEYLSIGKVIISNKIPYYSDKNLIEMVDENNNKKYPDLFKKVISNLEFYNSPELQRKRIEFALDNTYEKQIQRIEKIISDNLGEKYRHKNFTIFL
ncbi:MAG: glycosyltransferase [Bacteroidales bacterium]|nr:glycosyltransferase [Bacteroidales bacterium]